MDKATIQQLHYTAGQFELDGIIKSIDPFGSGHINDTFRVVTDHADGNGYIMQRINHNVFSDIEGLMDNILTLTVHLKSKLNEAGVNDDGWQQVLRVVSTKDGNSHFQDEQGNYWRLFDFIAGAKSYDVVETPQQAREGGRAIGRFQALLSDLDSRKIVEVLPHFHHIGKRFERLESAIAGNPKGRLTSVMDEILFIRAHKKRMERILERAAANQLPLRITHNDTKFNNILLDEHDRALCVIDLDTVMPGFVAYDFGDAIRTIISRAAEDEADLEKVKLNVPLFEAYLQGYMESAGDFLSNEEKDSLIDGVLLLPYMQAVRFLTDYLEGDQYFKIKHPSHNLQRTRAQLRLVQELIEREQELISLIEQASGRLSK